MTLKKKIKPQLGIIVLLVLCAAVGFIIQTLYFQPSADSTTTNPPTNVAAQVQGRDVVVTWTKPSGTSPKWYRIYRSTTENGSYSRVNHSKITATTFTDKNVTIPDSGFWYKVSPMFVTKTSKGNRTKEGQKSSGVALGGRTTTPTPTPTPTTTTSTQATYYVTASGSDSGPCNATNPCRQISYALTKAQPGLGDSISVAQGTYNGFEINSFGATLSDTDAVSKPLVIRGNNATITGFSRSTFNVNIEKSKGIIFDGIRVEGTGRNNLRVLDSSFITVQNSEFIGGASAGILMARTNNVMIDNVIARDSRENHGIYISDKSDGITIKRSYIYNNGGAGIQINAEKLPELVREQQYRSLATNVVIEDNIMYNNGGYGGATINMMGVQDAVITNNLILNNYASGIVAIKADRGTPSSVVPEAGPKNVAITNNTIVMASRNMIDSRRSVRYAVQFIDSAGENTVDSNIIYSPAGKAYDLVNTDAPDATYLVSDNNVYKKGSFVGLYDSGRAISLSSWKSGATWRGNNNRQNPIHDQNSDTESVASLDDLFTTPTLITNILPGSITAQNLTNYALKENAVAQDIGFDPTLIDR